MWGRGRVDIRGWEVLEDENTKGKRSFFRIAHMIIIYDGFKPLHIY